MIIDLLHNKIVSDTITEGFKKSVTDVLVPALGEIYGEGMLGIQMYEDYLADEFLLDGVFYYPMTVIMEDEQLTHWVAWRVSADKFTDLVPYSYVGEEAIAFDLSPVVPIDFETAIISRSRYCESGLIKINVHSTSPSPTFLAGKYSQTFIDEMVRQLTVAISEVMSVEGLADSGLELQLEFAPITYMEHHSENVTYRRLLLTDGASAPRDFWVKWINHRSDSPFTVSDHPLSDEIEFLIGEGVPQKLREREYRHLLKTNNDKYHSSMGKRNITEWRDLIKRAIKRGRLTRVLREIPLSDEVILVNAALANAAGLSTADVVSAGPSYDADNVNLDLATELARAAGLVVDTFIDEPDDAISFDDEPVSDKSDIDQDLLDLINHNREFVANREEEDELDSDEELDIEDDADDEIELVEESLESEEIDEEPAEEDFEDLDDEIDEEFEEIVDEESCCEAELENEECVESETEEISCEAVEEAAEPEIIEEIEENTVIVPEKMVETEESSEYKKPEPDLAEIEERLREGLEAKIRLEYEKQARASAENEMIELRRKHEQLLIENRRLEAQAKKEYEERRRISEQRKLENDRLRAEIETKVKAEAREKERLAEAARMAVEEKHRLERERLEAERRRIEDERRMAEDRARAEAEARVEAERKLEAERIRSAAKPQKDVEETEQPVQSNKNANYTYIAKTVKLLFRYSVDPNITVRIQEILAATLKHYDKSDLHIRVRATVPDNSSVILEFLEFPKEEIELLYEIIKILGASGIGIAKAILEDPKK